ncbi:lipopolysaccharide/colanic/teichoic acid biosynthesis glycosyltransferase [Bradyrhizobium sp. GM22.5]
MSTYFGGHLMHQSTQKQKVQGNSRLQIIGNYAYRHHVKPGITGWAQVNGYRGETRALEMMEKRVEHDLWYINNWSLWLDVKILLKTSVGTFRHRSAY